VTQVTDNGRHCGLKGLLVVSLSSSPSELEVLLVALKLTYDVEDD
jgi:hypothetical protein